MTSSQTFSNQVLLAFDQKFQGFDNFEDCLDKMNNSVTDIELENFKNRFSFCLTDHNDVTHNTKVYRHDFENWGKLNYFGRRADGKKVKIGRLTPDGERILSLKDDQLVLAEKLGSICTYHYYNTSSMFAGVIAEVICQLPPELKQPQSNDSYYIIQNGSVDFSKDGNTHCVILNIYKNTVPQE